MASEVSICNMALANIGAEALIATLTEDTEEARFCNIFYETLRDATLRIHPWNFATQFQTLADLGTPPSGFDFRYAYPTNCMHAIEIVNTVNTDRIEFEVANLSGGGKVILTDQDDAVLKFTEAITDTNTFDEIFIHTLAWNISMHIAEPLTGSSQKRQDAATIYGNILASARAIDSNEGKDDPDVQAEWITARL